MTHNVANDEVKFEINIKEEHLSNDNIVVKSPDTELSMTIVKSEFSKEHISDQDLSTNGLLNCVIKMEVEVDPVDWQNSDSFETSDETVLGVSSTNVLKLDIKEEKLDPLSCDETYTSAVSVTNNHVKKKIEIIKDPLLAKRYNVPDVTKHIVKLNEGSDVRASGRINKIARNYPKFKTKKDLNESKRPKFLCNICEYKFTNKKFLQMHIIQHKDTNKPYACSFCSRKFKISDTLKRHLKKHTAAKYGCNWCDKKFARNSLLKSHVSEHTGEKPFSCTYCDFRCNIGYLLKRHLKKHTDGKPYSCTFCEFKCSHSRILKAHLKTHTGDKPFVCVYCQYSCSRSADLKIHLRTHTGEKPFSCTYCDYTCCRSDQLRRHERVHTGEKAYSCPHCLYGCTRKRLLDQHLLKHTELLEISKVKTEVDSEN